MVRPRLLDLFCGAGGAAMGYYRAGFEVVGVDINHQPHYPFEFHQCDAMAWPLGGFDAVHASPPCQAFTSMLAGERDLEAGRVLRHPDYLTPTLRRLAAISQPWVVENVTGARRHMQATVVLHGGLFGLGVHRPRLFQSNMLLLAPSAAHVREPVGVYGHHPENSRGPRPDGGNPVRRARTIAEARDAMGIDWMDWPEIREAIPPAYTEFIGWQLIQCLNDGGTR